MGQVLSSWSTTGQRNACSCQTATVRRRMNWPPNVRGHTECAAFLEAAAAAAFRDSVDVSAQEQLVVDSFSAR
eukprot:96618-Rhodomonas_salina.3